MWSTIVSLMAPEEVDVISLVKWTMLSYVCAVIVTNWNGGTKSIRYSDWSRDGSMLGYKQRHCIHLKPKYILCPYRVTRYYKCMKRKKCQQRRQQQHQQQEASGNFCQSDGSHCLKKCCAKLMEDACTLAEMHLPSPLPCRKKPKKKTKQATQKTEPTPESSSLETVAEEEKVSQSEPTQDVVSSFITRIRTPPSTVLIDMARMQNWDMIVAKATRRDAKYRDADGLLPLHWAASGAPPLEVVESLLKLYPSAAKKLDNEGSTPLHFATHYSASPNVIQMLVRAAPKTVRLQDRHGRSPLYHAVDKCAGMESLKILVQADPSMVMVPCLPEEHRDLPLTRTTATMTPLYVAWVRVIRDCSRGSNKGKKCKPFEKAQLLLEASFFHLKNVSPSVPRDFHFLSGAIALDLYLPEAVVTMAMEEFPKELSVADMDGRLPLAQVAASSQYSKERSENLISLMLRAYQQAASARDLEGKSPLQLALLAGKTWSAGVSRLFQAHPEAIGWTDTRSGLLPFAAAASLEAQEAAASSSGLAGETPEAPALINDPYNLLTTKQRDLLERARKRVEERSSANNQGDNKETEGLTTILDLLRSDPSVITFSAR